MKDLGYTKRTGKSCNSRYTNHLTGKNKSEMTEAEEKIIAEQYQEELSFGEIRFLLDNRSHDWVRN